MRITPVSNINTYNANRKSQSPTFTAHPDFYKFNSTQSSYFRRGVVALPNPKFVEIERTFQMIFSEKPNEIKNMLIIGIGNSQETFSYLATIKSILKNRPLNKNLDLYTVDLQSKPDNKKIRLDAFYDAFYDYDTKPKFAADSFITDRKFPKETPTDIDPVLTLIKKYLKTPKEKEVLNYRVNDEILDFVKTAYNDPSKSKWDSRIQDVITTYPDDKFYITSANNILPYITPDGDILNTLKHIKRTLKPYGYFITEPYKQPEFIKKSKILDDMKEIFDGIYQKII